MYSTTSRRARPATVPRSASGTSGCRLVKPRTCASYTIVRSHGIAGRLSRVQLNAGSTTRHLGMNGALSRLSNDRSSSSAPIV